MTDEPALLAKRCEVCSAVFFPPVRERCGNPACGAEGLSVVELSRRGKVWSYTDAQYQPPHPYVPPAGEYEPFALAAVTLDEGLVVLGQVAKGFGVADIEVGSEVELVIETLNHTEDAELVIWRWKPATGGSHRNGADA